MRDRVYHFADVVIDVQNLQVTVGGEVRPLEPKSFRLLQFLVENPGRVLSKDAILAAVWPDAAVSDNSLTRAVTLIRKALDDDPKSPRYIETVPTVGYKFVAEIEVDEAAPVVPAPPAPIAEMEIPAPRRTWQLATLEVLAAGLISGAVYWLAFRPQPLPPEKLVPLTTEAGHERYPAFSPDGKQIAYYWDGPKGASPGIYVKLLRATNALRITSGSDAYPVWSSDGTRIAFVRQDQGGGIYTVSPLGGPERKISNVIPFPKGSTSFSAGRAGPGRSISWSLDGKWLVFANGAGRPLFLVSAEGGEARPLSDPKPPFYENSPAFSPDGATLAFAGCNSTYRCDVYVQQFGREGALHGSPRQVTHQDVELFGIAWSADGRSLIYSAAHTTSTPYLWRVPADGKSEPQRIEVAGVRAFSPSISGHRLAFETDLQNPDIFRYTVGGSIEPLITSSVSDDTPEYSPDGTRIVFCSDRTGDGYELWTAQADGSNPVQLTHGPGRNQGSPRWSFDGRWIVFDSEGADGGFEIYAIESGGGQPRQITPSPKSRYMPFFGPDGKWVYYLLFKNFVGDIWRMPFSGGAEEQVTQHLARVGFAAPDGRTLIYRKDSNGLFSMPIAGGAERELIPWVENRSFAANAEGVYYIGPSTPEGEHPIMVYSFATGTSRVLTKFKGPVLKGMTVSPDGKSVLFVTSVASGSHLMMIDNFRP